MSSLAGGDTDDRNLVPGSRMNPERASVVSEIVWVSVDAENTKVLTQCNAPMSRKDARNSMGGTCPSQGIMRGARRIVDTWPHSFSTAANPATSRGASD